MLQASVATHYGAGAGGTYMKRVNFCMKHAENEVQMSRFPLLIAAAFAAIGAAAFALPATAASVASCQSDKVIGPNGIPVDRIQLFADTYAIRLRQLGYDVERVEPWGGCVKAFVNDPGGGSHMQFFDPDTLEPLSTN